MTQWLFTAVCLQDRYCRQIENLQEEKIADHNEVIQLQKQLISKKDEGIGKFSEIMEAEIKSFSAVLQQNCTTALSPKKIATAVKKITTEEDRSKDVVIFGVAEEQGESVTSKVRQTLDHFEEKPVITDYWRIGQQDQTDQIQC